MTSGAIEICEMEGGRSATAISHISPLRSKLSEKIKIIFLFAPSIIDTEFFLGMFGNEKEEAIKRYERYMNQTNEDKCLEMVE